MYGSAPAVRFKQGEEWATRSFAEVGETVRALSLGLIDLGVAKGDKVSILANTRAEWTYADFAALSAGATVVPIYQTNSPEECQYVLENSDAKVVVVEDEEQMDKVRKVRDRLPLLEHVIRMTGASDDAISFEDLAARGASRDPSEWEARWQSVTPEDICTFIYTSGTTGPPKGCVISHGNYRAMLDMVNETSVIEDGDLTYLYLPLAHSFALLIQFGSFDLGTTIAYWERDPLKIMPNLAELHPTYFPSVPRIFEKIYTTATSAMDKEGGLKKAIFNWSIKVGKKMRALERSGGEPGFLFSRQYAFADDKVLSKIRALFGGKIRLAVSGAAPINPEILSFFDAAGVLVLEGWGMTETSTAATISSPDDFKIGTIGKPFPGCEIKIADDGEILVKGPNVFQGYYKNEEATRETIVDGWLHTGDIGEIDSDGLHQDHRPQKGHHHHRGRQEHHPGQPRERNQAAPARLPVRRRRRPPPLPGGAGHPRPRRGRRLRQGARPSRGPRAARLRRGRPQGDRSPRRGDQREVRPGRAGEEDRDPPRRPLPGERRVDADAQGQAGRGDGEARARDRGALRRLRAEGGRRGG